MNNESDYRLDIPRSIFELGLDPFEFRLLGLLWSHIVNYGEDCPSTETLLQESRMTSAQLSKAIIGLERKLPERFKKPLFASLPK
jgi:hypothetical protein